MYVKGKLSTHQIGKILNLDHSTVLRRLKKKGVVLRNRTNAVKLRQQKHIPLTKNLQDYIDGMLLGDGCVVMNSHSGALYIQAFASRYEEWAKRIKEDFEVFGMHSRFNEVEGGLLLATSTHPELTVFRERWYPEGKKIVPDDLVIEPITLLNWYLGDGSYEKERGRTHFATYGFSQRDVLLLKDKLVGRGITSSIYKGPRIYLNRKETIKGFEYMKGVDVPSCFAYKFGG